MSKGEKDSSDATTIDAIIKSLTSRPNVISTLILSRKDGSIIKSTGFRDSANKSSNVTSKQVETEEVKAVSSSGEDVGSGELDQKKKDTTATLTAAETLASSIYQFISAAETLALTMSNVQLSNASYTSTMSASSQDNHNRATYDDAPNNDHDVQLLRMRTKRQEIIIFPDPDYLCCVVQNVGRGTNADAGR